ncbi:hypothetical protein COCOBI_11-5810 [Coccomyxa sp. Obi]|nr:hypothetical protein COCOBI_11-5810 [Coccomyxa sp. Obi]
MLWATAYPRQIRGTMPLFISSADVIKRCLAQPAKDRKHHILTGAGEIPEADFELFLSYDTLPRRPAWKGISKEDYDRVKASFAQRGVTICKETLPDDMIKFKETLMYADMDLF